MPVNAFDIPTTEWSPKLAAFGEVVTDLDDIEQCLDIIVTTRKGSDPHRPLMGCDAWLWIDRPAAIAVPNICREVIEAIEIWEPRVTVDSVTVAYDDAGVPTVSITWQPKSKAYKQQTTEVTLGA